MMDNAVEHVPMEDNLDNMELEENADDNVYFLASRTWVRFN